MLYVAFNGLESTLSHIEIQIKDAATGSKVCSSVTEWNKNISILFLVKW